MKKTLVILCAVMLAFAIAGTASALTIELSLDPFSPGNYSPDPYVSEQYTVGTFSYDLAGLIITSAGISGQWGITGDDTLFPNSLNNNTTAGNEILFGDLEIASTGDTSAPTPWEYIFTDFLVFSSLKDGIDLFAVQTSAGSVHLDETTLTIETTPIPEPATMLLVASGLLGLAGFRRKKRT